MSSSNVYDQMVEITLPRPDNFRVVRETLSRIGIANSRKKRLWQSCHILNKGGKYYIAHFKTLMQLDGQSSSLSQEDQERVWDVARLLDSWGLCNIVNQSAVPQIGDNLFRVIKAAEKEDWELVQKYTVGV